MFRSHLPTRVAFIARYLFFLIIYVPYIKLVMSDVLTIRETRLSDCVCVWPFGSRELLLASDPEFSAAY